MNIIEITNLKVYAYHGVFQEEQEKGQDFYISAKLFLDTSEAARNDDLTKSVNYGEVCHFLTQKMTEKNFQLIESVADYLTTELLLAFPLLEKVSLTLFKPHAPIGLPFENVSIQTERSWHKVYLSIGSNIGDRKNHLDTAIETLKKSPRYQIKKISDYIETEPYGYTEQDIFLNGAVYLRTIDTPIEVLDTLHAIENSAKRERTIHWGPRTLDLDILLYDDLITDDEHLVIPHPDMHNRAFVLTPLAQIAPHIVHPLLRIRISELAMNLS